MSDIKCPFCNSELVGTIGHPICRNQDCVMCDDPMPQDLLEELIRTRKALDVAIHRLNQIAEHNCDQGCMYVAQNALEQITALEQKERKGNDTIISRRLFGSDETDTR